MKARTPAARAFTMIELVMVLVIFTLLAHLMLPVMKQRWNADGLSQSLNNVRQILQATGQYRLASADRVPMRACGYSGGQITGGWDSWNFAGKNNSQFWIGSAFDESAYGRFLNPFLQAEVAAVPAGYVNTGSGSTWTFNDGTPTFAQRESFQVPVCKSPGDLATRQRQWPNPTAGISAYDDVGTSYFLNMRWWTSPGSPPANFTARYNAGTQAINTTVRGPFGIRPTNDFVWIHDQTADVVSNLNGIVQGEFGGRNMSVAGYLDGRCAYLQIANNAMSGPGYTFAITWP